MRAHWTCPQLASNAADANSNLTLRRVRPAEVLLEPRMQRGNDWIPRRRRSLDFLLKVSSNHLGRAAVSCIAHPSLQHSTGYSSLHVILTLNIRPLTFGRCAAPWQSNLDQKANLAWHSAN